MLNLADNVTLIMFGPSTSETVEPLTRLQVGDGSLSSVTV